MEEREERLSNFMLWQSAYSELVFDGLYLSKGAITKAINKLEKNSYVTREKLKEDKRQYILKLTPKGESIIPLIEEINNEWEKKMDFKNLNPEFYETFKQLTAKSIDLN